MIKKSMIILMSLFVLTFSLNQQIESKQKEGIAKNV